MVLRGSERGFRIVELDAPYSPRVGRSKVTGTLRGTMRAIHDMSALLRDAPSRAAAPRPAATSAVTR
ncbi:hypothetical protein GCM10025867_18150 [Frondihabitans sucicola]|uniref:Uncharacterized protein n=1 Tax=Frondihabitans sucicola TaxID=1268041 RepID=A0ABM8GME3_9MICO|nr:hypothetical protein GCM10025867_18150 [Frondihabitans sucicola]